LALHAHLFNIIYPVFVNTVVRSHTSVVLVSWKYISVNITSSMESREEK